MESDPACRTPPFQPGLLIGQIYGDALAKTAARFCQADSMKIAHHIGGVVDPGVSRQVTAQGEIASVVQVKLL
jgi:hypothetical protein